MPVLLLRCSVSLLEKYHSAGMTGLWAASSFKGSTNVYTCVPSTQWHVDNHLQWLKVAASLSAGVSLRGIAITGWQRLESENTYRSLIHTSVMFGWFGGNQPGLHFRPILSPSGMTTCQCSVSWFLWVFHHWQPVSRHSSMVSSVPRLKAKPWSCWVSPQWKWTQWRGEVWGCWSNSCEVRVIVYFKTFRSMWPCRTSEADSLFPGKRLAGLVVELNLLLNSEDIRFLENNMWAVRLCRLKHRADTETLSCVTK